MNLLRITRIGIKFVQLLFILFVSSFTQINNRYKVTNLRLNDSDYVWKENISWLYERKRHVNHVSSFHILKIWIQLWNIVILKQQ